MQDNRVYVVKTNRFHGVFVKDGPGVDFPSDDDSGVVSQSEHCLDLVHECPSGGFPAAIPVLEHLAQGSHSATGPGSRRPYDDFECEIRGRQIRHGHCVLFSEGLLHTTNIFLTMEAARRRRQKRKEYRCRGSNPGPRIENPDMLSHYTTSVVSFTRVSYGNAVHRNIQTHVLVYILKKYN